jgi:hypothetical protein
VFEIVSELMAEGWVNAVSKFKKGEDTPLSFDAKSAAPKRRMQNRSANHVAPASLPETGRKPDTYAEGHANRPISG